MIGKLPRNGRIVSALGLSIQEHSQNVYGQNSIPCPALGPREAPVESAAEPSAVEFYTIASMLPTVLSEVNETKTSLYGFQYVADHTMCVVKMVWKFAKGMRIRVAFGKMSFTRSSCARQAIRIRELWDAGCEIKTMKLRGAVFACMHAKSFIFDEEVLVTGSVNMAHNG
jgi:hypothetical protein